MDSFAALSVMRALRRLAAAGHTIIASIHQPPPSIWNLLDEVVLLANGRTMYTGCPTKVMTCKSYEDINGRLHAREAYILDLMAPHHVGLS